MIAIARRAAATPSGGREAFRTGSLNYGVDGWGPKTRTGLLSL